LFFESKLYNYLNADNTHEIKGIPKTFYYGVEGDYNVLVMEILGKLKKNAIIKGQSLENLFESNARKFSIKTVLMLGI